MIKRDKYERIEIVNKLIEFIGEKGRTFLYSKKHTRIAYFVYDGRSLWFIDHYTGVPLKMVKGETYKTRKQERYFSSGGTMWGLVNDFKDFIYGDDDSNHNNGYGGLYCTHWGYPPEEMESIRQFAREIGYLKEEVN